MTTLRETIANPIVEDMDNLRHMLGVRMDISSSRWCYRNYYNSGPVRSLQWSGLWLMAWLMNTGRTTFEQPSSV